MDPFIGEIKMFGGSFAPVGWMMCQGQLLPISEYDTLFSLIGTTYGGDGQVTFALPDLRGRVIVHQGNNHVIGEMAGTESVTLTSSQIGAHNHLVACSSAKGTVANPGGNVPAASATAQYMSAPNTSMNGSAVGPAGGNQPHNNMPPYLVVNYIICYEGIYPQRS
jgi:microcystin-dependent protein